VNVSSDRALTAGCTSTRREHRAAKELLSSLALLPVIWASATMGADPGKAVFRPLPAATAGHMDRQRAYVASLLKKHFPGTKITRTRADFATLQRVVDAKLIPANRTWEWQSVGIVFGDALASAIPGLQWYEVTDAYGTDPTLRYKSTSLQINAMTMISKRIEDGEEVDVAHLATWLADFVKNKAHEYQ
jgi:hypothetical protein